MHPISRRQFLRRGTVAAAATLATSLAPPVSANPLDKPIGLQLYTVADALQKDVAGTLKQIGAIGYKEVETAGFAGLTAKQFRQAVDDAGLKCRSCHLQMNAPDLGPVFADAHTLGAHYVVCSAMFPSTAGSPPTFDDYKKLAALLNDIARRATQANLQYAYHNHNFEFKSVADGTLGYDVLLAQTDPELVDFELDCGWIIAAGQDPIRYFRKYPHRYKMLHIKDFVAGSKISTSLSVDRPQGTELGRGHIDYKPIFAAAANTEVEYYYVEQEPPFPDMSSLDAIKVDYDYLHQL
ncbi:MAG: sugar phosphate isomerase/epimerase [Candidatus Acidiferrales bacterium]